MKLSLTTLPLLSKWLAPFSIRTKVNRQCRQFSEALCKIIIDNNKVGALFFSRASTYIVVMPAFLNWKATAIALLITTQKIVSAQDSEFLITDNSLPSSPTQSGDFPVIDRQQSSSLRSPNNAASLLSNNYNWGIGYPTQQVSSQQLDETDSLLLANENNPCQISPDQSQNTWRRRRARMRRDDEPGGFCSIDSQPVHSGGSVGQHTPTQLRQTPETNARKSATDEVKLNDPYKPGRGRTIPSNLVEFEQDLKDGIIKLGQSDEQMCSKASNAKKKIPVCYIGYPPLSRDVLLVLPHVRAGELIILFPAPKHVHYVRHHKRLHTNQNMST